MKNIKMITGLLILTASIIVLNEGSLLCTMLFFLSILFCVAVLPDTRRRESAWLFILTATTTIPINIALMIVLERYVNTLTGGIIGKISGMIVLYACIFSIEELVIGVIGRLIYRNQVVDDLNR